MTTHGIHTTSLSVDALLDGAVEQALGGNSLLNIAPLLHRLVDERIATRHNDEDELERSVLFGVAQVTQTRAQQLHLQITMIAPTRQ